MLLQIENHRLHYDIVGPQNGLTVCFAHALAADSGMWAEQVPGLLPRGFRVLRIEMRGHGGSDPTRGPYSLLQFAADIVAVLDALAIAEVDFVGLSVGGMIGQALAIAFRERLSSLMLCESPPASLRDAKAIWQPRLAAVRAANALEPIADATMERWLTPAFRASNPLRWKQIRDTVAATSVAGYCGGVAALCDFDFTRELPGLKLRTLVLFGEDDSASSRQESERLAVLIPGARFVSFPGARHLPNVENPERFNAILTDWLAA